MFLNISGGRFWIDLAIAVAVKVFLVGVYDDFRSKSFKMLGHSGHIYAKTSYEEEVNEAIRGTTPSAPLFVLAVSTSDEPRTKQT